MTKTERAVSKHFKGLVELTSKLNETKEINKSNDYLVLMMEICSTIQKGGEIRFRITDIKEGRLVTFDHYINEI